MFVEFYKCSYNSVMDMPWVAFIGMLDYRNESIARESKEMEKLKRRIK